MIKHRTKKLFFKFLIIMLIFLLVPVISIGTYSYLFSGIYAEKSIINSNLAALNQVSETFELVLNELDALSIQYNFIPEIIEYKNLFSTNELSYKNLNIINKLIQNINISLSSKPYIHSVYIYFENPYGYYISSTYGLQNINSSTDSSWYASYQANSKNFSAWEEKRTTEFLLGGGEQKILSLYRLLPIDDEYKNGTVVINLNSEYLDKIINNIEKNNLKYFFITNIRGNIIGGNHDNMNLIPGDILNKVHETKNGYYTGIFDNQKSLISYSSSKFFNWSYVTITPLYQVYGASDRIWKITIVISCLCLIMGILLAYLLSRLFLKPVKNIIKMITMAKTSEVIYLPTIKDNNEYDYIAYNLLQSFLSQRNLQKELSERAFKLKDAELFSLQAQINPHFLYNTLESINWLAIRSLGDENDISVLTTCLSNLLRYSVEAPDELTSLKFEISHAENYIQMLSYRYRNKFSVKWDIPGNLLEYKTIKLFLQPLLENSIYHGIKERDEKGYIKIKGRRKENYLFISVIDNGLGMKKEKLYALREIIMDNKHTQYKHIGISNVNRRVYLQFGTEYGVSINSKYNFGTVVTVKLPVLK